MRRIIRKVKENEDLIKKYKVRETGIFGSFFRGEEAKESDIDVLVEFEQEGKNFDNYIELKFFLEEK